MKTLVPAWFILSAAAGLAMSAAQSTKDSRPELIGRLPAEPDVVLEWNAAINDHFEEFSLATTSHIQARVYAMVHLAMRDAVAATTRESRHDAAGALAKSAASAAAHDILVALRPAGVNRFTSLHARHLGAIANDSGASHGRKIGQRIAASILSSRANDGWPVALSQSTAETTGRDSRRGTLAKPTPFVLKRAQHFEPEQPYLAYNDGVAVPNGKLRNKKLIGTPADIALPALTAAMWRTEPVLRWNRTAQSLAVQQPQDLPARARLFASLNAALADALLSATYWSEAYNNGHLKVPIAMVSALDALGRVVGAQPGSHAPQALSQDVHDALYRAVEPGDMPPLPGGTGWVASPLSGFPAIPAAIAGAAEAILRGGFGDNVVFALPAKTTDTSTPDDFTNLRSAARQCAWAEFVGGASTPEGCVAGYDLGSRIAGHVLKQDRR